MEAQGLTPPIERERHAEIRRRAGNDPGGRRIRVPLSPGTFSTLEVASVEPLAEGQPVELSGGGVMAYDGERNTPVSAHTTVTASVERSGPHMIDVERTLQLAALDQQFDVRAAGVPPRKDIHGD